MEASQRTFYLPDGQVKVTYLPAGGGTPIVKTETIPASFRKTFNMAEHSGITGRASITVTRNTTGKKIMRERAMYWNSRGAGADTIGGIATKGPARNCWHSANELRGTRRYRTAPDDMRSRLPTYRTALYGTR